MQLKERRFPYPVLSQVTSDYPLGDFTYEVREQDGCLYIDCDLHEDTINEYIQKGDFTYVVGIESPQTKSRKIFKQKNPHFTIPLVVDELGNNLHLNVLILAVRDVNDYPTTHLNSVYHGRKIFFKKGDYIAKCPTHTITFEFENESRKPGIVVKENKKVDSFTVDIDREVIAINLSSKNFGIYKNYRNAKKIELLTSIFYSAIMAGVTHLVLSDNEDLNEENQGWIPLVLKKINQCGYSLEDLRQDASLIINVVNLILKNPLNDLFVSFDGGED